MYLLLFLLPSLTWSNSCLATPIPTKPNILMIISDDYRPEGRLGLDPHPGGSKFETPNIAKLAKKSIVFDSAFSTSPSCGPSRAALLTGFNTDKLRYWSFVSAHWRGSGTAQISLPQYFRSQGYKTVALGKIFHFDDVYRDDASFSWDRTIYTGPFSGGEEKCAAAGEFFCTCPAGGNCVDENLASEAIQEITGLSRQDSPWFLALGFRRPHMDWTLPTSWLESKGMDDVAIPMPVNREMDASIPNQAFYACDPILDRQGENMLPQGAHLSDDLTIKIKRYYWATVTFMDEQLGRVIDYFDGAFPKVSAETIVIFLSDHGWSLGEKGLWCKQNLFDDGNRVAMMVRAPWISSGGDRVSRPVSMLDVFPSLVDLTGVRVPLFAGCFGGKSLFSGVDDEQGVISSFPRCLAGKGLNAFSNPCMNVLPSNFQLMGYSLRTRYFRYTEWRRWNGANSLADWSQTGLVARELYDHRGNTMSPSDQSTFEVRNVAENPDFAKIIESLAFNLKSRVTNPEWFTRCTVTGSPTVRPTNSPTTSRPSMAPTRRTSSPTLPPTSPPIPATPVPTKRPSTPVPTKLPSTMAPVSPAPSSASPTMTKLPTAQPVTTRAPSPKPTPVAVSTTAPSPKPTPEPLPLKATDLAMYQKLYDATNGPDWVSCKTSRSDPCNPEANGCDLQQRFIVCEIVDKELRLVELVLPNNRMKGIVPLGIFSIVTLKVIDFSNDQTRDQDPNANIFLHTSCISAPKCFLPDVACAFRNAGVTICGSVTARDCPRLERSECVQALGVCRWFTGGYDCQVKTFCGFLTKRYVGFNPSPMLVAQGIRTGAQGCVGKENIKRCAWVNNSCKNRF